MMWQGPLIKLQTVDVQRPIAAIASTLRENGFDTCTAHRTPWTSALLPDYNKLVTHAHEFVNSDKVRQAANDLQNGVKRADRKQFLVKQETTSNLLVMQFFKLYPIVAAAFGTDVEPYHSDLWCVLPTPGLPRDLSQDWHRDRDGSTVVKVFLYFTDVTEESGPLQYVVGSHAGKYADIVPERERSYPTAEERERILDKDVVTLAVPAGTLAFVNTTGLHRGGYAKSQPRVCAVWSFVRK